MITAKKIKGNIAKYKPHVNQKKLHHASLKDDDVKEIVVVASIRSGKTYSIIWDVIVSAWNNKTGFGILVCAPTFRLLESVLERPIVSELKELDLIDSHSYSKHETTLKNGNVIYYRSVEKDAIDVNLRGLNVSKIYIDEAAYADSYAMEVIRGRALTTNAKIILITTPKGQNNWLWDYYFSSGELNNVKYIKYSALDNPIIKEDALERLKESYSTLMYRQEVLGEFVNLTQNLVYYAFDRDSNTKQTVPKPNAYLDLVLIGIDWNIGKNPVIFMYRNDKGEYIVFKEVFGLLSATEVGKYIKQYIESEKILNYAVVDDAASGNARNQDTSRTNRQMLASCGVFNIAQNKTNPGRLNRVELVNAFLCNAKGQRKLIIDKSCTNCIQDLEQLTYKSNGFDFETKGEKIGHAQSALGYAIYYRQDGSIY